MKVALSRVWRACLFSLVGSFCLFFCFIFLFCVCFVLFSFFVLLFVVLPVALPPAKVAPHTATRRGGTTAILLLSSCRPGVYFSTRRCFFCLSFVSLGVFAYIFAFAVSPHKFPFHLLIVCFNFLFFSFFFSLYSIFFSFSAPICVAGECVVPVSASMMACHCTTAV